MKCTPVMTERVVETTVKELTGVTLELTVMEAQRLLSIVGSISGDGPIRDTTNKIYLELYEVFKDKGYVKRPFDNTARLNGKDVSFD